MTNVGAPGSVATTLSIPGGFTPVATTDSPDYVDHTKGHYLYEVIAKSADGRQLAAVERRDRAVRRAASDLQGVAVVAAERRRTLPSRPTVTPRQRLLAAAEAAAKTGRDGLARRDLAKLEAAAGGNDQLAAVAAHLRRRLRYSRDPRSAAAMKLTLLTIGSRGDVQPFLALGRALADAGHEPRIATHPHFGPLVRRAELEFAPIAEGAISAGPQSAESERWIRSRSRYLPTWVGYLQDARSVAGERLSDALSACSDSDAIIASDLATIVGWQMAEHFGRPLIRVNLNLPAGGRSMRGPIPRAVRGVAWRAARVWLDGVRDKIGLPALPEADPVRALDRSPGPGPPRLQPARRFRSDRRTRLDPRDRVLVSGPAARPRPLARAVEFIAAGPPPVCMDFGSMLDADPSATTRLAVEALQRAGRRGVLIRGRYRASDVQLPTTVLGIDAAPHDWLLQALLRGGTPRRCRDHRGGAGGGRAVSPGPAHRRPAALGPPDQRAGGRHHPDSPPPAVGRATARRRRHGDREPRTQRNAALLGATVRAENGVGAALRVIERHLDNAAQPMTASRVGAR